MTPHDQGLVRFLCQWMPYGGGDDEILPEFGIAPREFYNRLVHLLDARSTQIDFAQRQRLREFCCLKVRHYSTQASKGKL